TPFLRRPATPAPAELASALGSYARVQTAMLTAWSDLVAYLYDGRMLALLRAGRAWVGGGSSVFKSAAQRHIERHIALQATGWAPRPATAGACSACSGVTGCEASRPPIWP